MATRHTPGLLAGKGESLTLADLRDFVEAAALYSGDAKIRVRLVPFKEMTHPDGQPIKSLTIEHPEAGA